MLCFSPDKNKMMAKAEAAMDAAMGGGVPVGALTG